MIDEVGQQFGRVDSDKGRPVPVASLRTVCSLLAKLSIGTFRIPPGPNRCRLVKAECKIADYDLKKIHGRFVAALCFAACLVNEGG